MHGYSYRIHICMYIFYTVALINGVFARLLVTYFVISTPVRTDNNEHFLMAVKVNYRSKSNNYTYTSVTDTVTNRNITVTIKSQKLYTAVIETVTKWKY